MNKKTIYILAAVTSILGIGFWLAPANVKDKITGITTAMTDERRCFNFYKEDFVDPESAYVKGSRIWTKQEELQMMTRLASPDDPYPVEEMMSPVFKNYDAVLQVDTYAKNRMGGYVSNVLECPLVNGHFDEHAARKHKLETRAMFD